MFRIDGHLAAVLRSNADARNSQKDMHRALQQVHLLVKAARTRLIFGLFKCHLAADLGGRDICRLPGSYLKRQIGSFLVTTYKLFGV